MRSPNGYSKELTRAHWRDYTFVACGYWGSKQVDGKSTETCYFDEFWNCNQFQGCDTCSGVGAGSCRTKPAGRYLDGAGNATTSAFNSSA
jgi:hypothetical protein